MSKDKFDSAGRWVTEKTYALAFNLSRQTLANWRFRDRKAGRSEAQADFPQYKRFGRAVRYWVPHELFRRQPDASGQVSAGSNRTPVSTNF